MTDESSLAEQIARERQKLSGSFLRAVEGLSGLLPSHGMRAVKPVIAIGQIFLSLLRDFAESSRLDKMERQIANGKRAAPPSISLATGSSAGANGPSIDVS